MAEHEDSINDIVRTGVALQNWYLVIFEDRDIAQCDDLKEMRGLYEMSDTDANRDLLIVAASRTGLPEDQVNVLTQWVNADRVKADAFPADKAFFSKDVHEIMSTDLAVAEAE